MKHTEQVLQRRAIGRAAVHDAMRAWFAGDFEGCLEICAHIRRRDIDTISQVALLRGRALLRLGRPAEAERAVRDVFTAHGTLDASLTAQMLLGAARVRQGDIAGGLEILDRAQFASNAAHPTIRSEVALNRALAHYARRDLNAATAALDRVDDDADIVSARALEYRGWVATARGQYAQALGHFRAALLRLDGCRRQDVFLAANALQAMSFLAVEQLQKDTWFFIERRAAAIDWSISGLAGARYWLLMASALMYEDDGQPLEAYRAAREAEEAAPSPAFRVQARCRRAVLARCAGETIIEHDLAQSALAMFEQLDPQTLAGDERIVPLDLAEALAHVGKVDAARRVLAIYAQHREMDRTVAAGEDLRRRGYERLVEATVAEAAGEPLAAHDGYREAFQIFRRLGYVRRAAQAAIRLAQITGLDYLYQYASTVTAHLHAHSATRRQLRDRARIYSDPVGKALSHTKREVLLLVCEGLSYPEIAAIRNRSPQTIRNMVSQLLKAFGVESRSELIVECVRRGVYLPAPRKSV